MRILTRLLIVAALAYFGWVLFQDGHREFSKKNEDGESIADASKVVAYFGGVILVGIGVGCVIALSLVPAVGEAVGHFFYNPNEIAERDPHELARSKMAQGDYEGAIAEYASLFEKDPHDTLSVSEMAHIYCEKLGDPISAEDVLEKALAADLPVEEAAFISSRLVDVYWKYQHDADRARKLLINIAETLPNTKHAANAVHRLHEIDRVLMGEDPGPVG